MKQRCKNLIISPHADDEVLSCSSVLGKDSFVYYCGLNEELVPPDRTHRIGIKAKLEEISAVATFLGFSWEYNPASRVNNYTENEFISAIEELVNRLKPNRIFIPFPCYNQDHRAVYNAAQIAIRPHDKNFFVGKVFVYEQCHSVIWEHKDFPVTYFVPLDIRRKLKAYRLYKSQVRRMRSSDLISAIARVRGAQANCAYAEAFWIQRWVD